MTQELILEALKGLDPKNDDHWTADGLPRLDVVKAGRSAITKAAPNFSRANPNLEPKPKEDEVPAKVTPDYKTAFQMESSEFGSSDDDDDEGDKPAAPPSAADVVAQVTAASVAVDATLDQLAAAKLAKQEADAELDKARAEHDQAVRAAVVPIPPHVQTQNVLMAFLDAQVKQPAQKAQIDKVMERKTGYGLKRPMFTPRG